MADLKAKPFKLTVSDIKKIDFENVTLTEEAYIHMIHILLSEIDRLSSYIKTYSNRVNNQHEELSKRDDIITALLENKYPLKINRYV